MATTPTPDHNTVIDTVEPPPLPEPLFDLCAPLDAGHMVYICRICGAAVVDPNDQHPRRDAHRAHHVANRSAIGTLTTMVRSVFDGLGKITAALDELED